MKKIIALLFILLLAPSLPAQVMPIVNANVTGNFNITSGTLIVNGLPVKVANQTNNNVLTYIAANNDLELTPGGGITPGSNGTVYITNASGMTTFSSVIDGNLDFTGALTMNAATSVPLILTNGQSAAYISISGSGGNFRVGVNGSNYGFFNGTGFTLLTVNGNGNVSIGGILEPTTILSPTLSGNPVFSSGAVVSGNAAFNGTITFNGSSSSAPTVTINNTLNTGNANITAQIVNNANYTALNSTITTSPFLLYMVASDNYSAGIGEITFGHAGARYGGWRSQGTSASPSATQDNEGLAELWSGGYDGGNWTNGGNTQGGIQIRSFGTWSPTAEATHVDIIVTSPNTTAAFTAASFQPFGNVSFTPVANTFNGNASVFPHQDHYYGLQWQQTYNQTSTAGSTDFLINRTETALGSGSQLFEDFQVNTTSKWTVDNTGNLINGIVPVARLSGINAYALLASPTFTGTPLAPNQTVADNADIATNHMLFSYAQPLNANLTSLATVTSNLTTVAANLGLYPTLAANNVFSGNNSFNGTATVNIAGIGQNTSGLGNTGLLLNNPTAAASNAQQYSPSLVLEGQGWKTASGGASQPNYIFIQNIPSQGTNSEPRLFIGFGANTTTTTTGLIFDTATATWTFTNVLSAQTANFSSSINASAVGSTLFIKGGSNSKAGTFTLASGTANVTNTAITANSSIVITMKTLSGTITTAPFISNITAGTNFTVTGTATDNSTYNYVILESN